MNIDIENKLTEDETVNIPGEAMDTGLVKRIK